MSTVAPTPAPTRRRNPQLLIGLTAVAVILLVALLAPLLATHDPLRVSGPVLQPPSGEHWLGTDRSGLDIFSRVVYAPRVDLLLAGVGTLLAALLGVPLGALAGYAPGVVGEAISRTLDVVQAFPFFILAMCLLGIVGGSLPNIIAVLAIVNAPIYARLMHSQTRTLRGRMFIDAARVSGCLPRQVILGHIVPNSLSPILAQMSVTLGMSIILVAGVSFVGAGVEPPTAEWGVMIGDGSGGMFTGQWWPVVFPGIALALTVVAFALVSNGITVANQQRSRRA
ncbi:ABC transporter permease [Jiangella alba]|uniref:Peptide/nickel transport system permease protein n=1 Tax=Jiangella alba TaxID=561176 RepID=A0A1H5Q0U9_9ACTN|nr:ABC transporter permease [Jiangella alba]SEF18867.1 peptide/nickel transport system permease protein [Jiangella alba]